MKKSQVELETEYSIFKITAPVSEMGSAKKNRIENMH